MRTRRRIAISTLIMAGYALIIIAVANLGWFATDSMKELRAITQDLYVHPFTVSNAAANLKGTLFQLRNQMIQIVMIKSWVKDKNLVQMELAAEAYDKSARKDMALIKANFLGDMGRIRELEGKLDQWDVIRAEILEANRKGNAEKAESLLRTVGTQKFNEMDPLLNYILNFAKNKAGQYVSSAENKLEQIVARMYWMTILLIAIVLATAVFVYLRVRYLQNELERQASTDFLTGVPNRRHFMNLADREINRYQRYGNPFSLAIVDLDWFKKINDAYGHNAGDLVLKMFCEVCLNVLRNSDILGRIGGEEFAILMPSTSIFQAQEVVERVRKAVEDCSIPVDGHDTPIRFTASFGLTECSPESVDMKSIFGIADRALYKAKESGRNRVYIL